MSASEVSTFEVFTFLAKGVPRSSEGSPIDRRIIVTSAYRAKMGTRLFLMPAVARSNVLGASTSTSTPCASM